MPKITNNMVKFDELKALIEASELDAKKVDAGNQAAGQRIRKATFAMAKVLKEVRLETKKA